MIIKCHDLRVGQFMLCSKKKTRKKQEAKKPRLFLPHDQENYPCKHFSSFHVSRHKVSQEMWVSVAVKHREFFLLELKGLGVNLVPWTDMLENEALAVTSPRLSSGKLPQGGWVGREKTAVDYLMSSGWEFLCLLFQFLRIRARKLSESSLLHPRPLPPNTQPGRPPAEIGRRTALGCPVNLAPWEDLPLGEGYTSDLFKNLCIFLVLLIK